jgi:hypothetical protein
MGVNLDGKKFSIGDDQIDIIVHGFPATGRRRMRRL